MMEWDMIKNDHVCQCNFTVHIEESLKHKFVARYQKRMPINLACPEKKQQCQEA